MVSTYDSVFSGQSAGVVPLQAVQQSAFAAKGMIRPDGSPLIQQPVKWYDTPGSHNAGVAPRPGRSGVLTNDLMREYVADSRSQWYLNWIRALSFTVDDITTSFGDDLYERMLFDPDVAAAFNTFKTAVLENGMTLAPAIDDKDQDGYDVAVKLQGLAERALEELDGFGFESCLWNMLDACGFGNKVSEMNFRFDSTYTGRTIYVPHTIRVKPRRSTAFVVDVHMNVVGLVGIVPGIGFPVQVGTLIADPDKQPNLIARDKFMCLTFRPRDEDPRGTSMLRPAYTAWNLKQQVYGEFMKWLTQFATPSIIGMTPPEAEARPMRDAVGNVVLGADGNPIMLSPEQAMANTLANLRNSSAVAFPNGSEVTPLEMRGQGGPFYQAFSWLGQQIATAILYQTLTNQPAEYGTKAQASVHENVLETLVHQAKLMVIRMVRHDLLRRWVYWNFGPELVPLTPRPHLGETEEANFAEDAKTYAALGYSADQSQFTQIDRKLNLPDRSPDWQQQQQQRALMQSETQAAAYGQGPLAQGGAPPAGGGGAPQGDNAPQGGPPQGDTAQMSATMRRLGMRFNLHAPPPSREEALKRGGL